MKLFPSKINLVIASFFLLLSINIPAQNIWGLQKCIDYALKNNITIKQNELNTENADAHVTQSYMSFLPNLNGNASNFYNYGRSVDPLTNTFTTSRVMSANFSVSAGLTIFNGLQLQNTLK